MHWLLTWGILYSHDLHLTALRFGMSCFLLLFRMQWISFRVVNANLDHLQMNSITLLILVSPLNSLLITFQWFFFCFSYDVPWGGVPVATSVVARGVPVRRRRQPLRQSREGDCDNEPIRQHVKAKTNASANLDKGHSTGPRWPSWSSELVRDHQESEQMQQPH